MKYKEKLMIKSFEQQNIDQKKIPTKKISTTDFSDQTFLTNPKNSPKHYVRHKKIPPNKWFWNYFCSDQKNSEQLIFLTPFFPQHNLFCNPKKVSDQKSVLNNQIFLPTDLSNQQQKNPTKIYYNWLCHNSKLTK